MKSHRQPKTPAYVTQLESLEAGLLDVNWNRLSKPDRKRMEQAETYVSDVSGNEALRDATR